jgi:hypothetical protein
VQIAKGDPNAELYKEILMRGKYIPGSYTYRQDSHGLHDGELLLIPAHAHKGQTWSVGNEVTSRYSILSTTAKVKTPARTFTNVVELEVAHSSGLFYDMYFAPQVGLVKEVVTVGGKYLQMSMLLRRISNVGMPNPPSYLPKKAATYVYDFGSVTIGGKTSDLKDSTKYTYVQDGYAISIDEGASDQEQDVEYQSIYGLYDLGSIGTPAETASWSNEEKIDRALDNKPMRLELKFPLRQGETWSSNGETLTVLSTSTQVKTPYKEFSHAVEVQAVDADGTISKRYYVPDIGLVKISQNNHTPPMVLSDIK